MIMAITLISCVIGLYKRSLKSFFSAFWSYSSVILSDYYSIPKNTRVDRLLSGVWLMSCIVLLASFSGMLRGHVLQPKPIYWIDTWEELYKWNLNIQTHSQTDIAGYAQNEDNTMARAFYQRIKWMPEPVTRNGIMNKSQWIDSERLRTGTVAVVLPFQYMQLYKKFIISDDFREDIDFHISHPDKLQPYFSITVRETLDQSIVKIYELV